MPPWRTNTNDRRREPLGDAAQGSGGEAVAGQRSVVHPGGAAGRVARRWRASRRLCIPLMLMRWLTMRGQASRRPCTCRSVIATFIARDVDPARLPVDRLIAEVAATQHGAASRQQLVTLGVGRGGIASRV